MNLPLFSGWTGILVAALIAFLIGVACLLLWRWLGRRAGLSEAQAIGWACVTSVAIGAGIDTWHLFYLGVVTLESPLYARIALAKIHDADNVGTRAFLEWAGALSGVVTGWVIARDRDVADAGG
jgi:hypothetical protein